MRTLKLTERYQLAKNTILLTTDKNTPIISEELEKTKK